MFLKDICMIKSEDWTTGVQSPAEVKDFSFSLCVKTSSDAHPATYAMGNKGPILGVKHGWGCDANHSSHLVSSSRMRSYTSSPPIWWYWHRITPFIAYFQKVKVSLSNHQPVCVCVCVSICVPHTVNF
jgi:hypothetical protein